MPFPIPSSQNLQIPKKKQYQPPFKSSRRQKSVFRLRRNGRRDKEREREKETKLLKLKAGLCSILLFLDVQKPKAKLFGSHKCISLCCLFVWGVGVRIKKKDKKKHRRRRRREKRKEFFF